MMANNNRDLAPKDSFASTRILVHSLLNNQSSNLLNLPPAPNLYQDEPRSPTVNLLHCQQQQQHQQQQLNATASPAVASLESRMMMLGIMIRRAAQRAQEMQQLHNVLLAEQRHQQHVLVQRRQMAALLEQQQQQQQHQVSPLPSLDLLRSMSSSPDRQSPANHNHYNSSSYSPHHTTHSHAYRQPPSHLGLSMDVVANSFFPSPSPNQQPTTGFVGDLSMLPRIPFGNNNNSNTNNPATAPTSSSNMTTYSPSPSSPNRRDTVKLFVDEIRESDVLCGRGARSNHNSGNKRYRLVVSEMKASYRTTEAKTRKTDLSRAIVDHVCQYGGRFLKKDSHTGNYYILTKAEARKKTSQALRETKELKWTL